MGNDDEVAYGRLTRVEEVAQPVGSADLREVERRDEGPDAAPVAGEDAGPRGGAGAEVEEDEDDDVVG